MNQIALFAVLAALTALFGYSTYVAVLVMRADFYSKPQKFAQAFVAMFVPLLGAVVVHWFLAMRMRAKP